MEKLLLKIFLSYTLINKDNTFESLKNIQSHLMEFSDIYIDLFENERSQEKVESELQKSDLLLIVKSDNVFKSQWVQKELELAKSFKKPIFTKTNSEILESSFYDYGKELNLYN